VAGDGLTVALFAHRTGLNLAALLTIGLALHGALGIVERSAFQRFRGLLVLTALGVAMLAATRLPFLNIQMGDASSAFDPDLTSLGWLALGPSTLAFAGGAIIAVLGAGTARRSLLALGAMVISAGFGLTGHTQGLEDPGLMPLAVSLHTLIGGFWIVAPMTLRPSQGLGDAELLARLQRFSTLAVLAIPALVVLGLWLAWILAQGWVGLFGSAYGQLLLVKLAAALAAMAMGAINQKILTARVRTDPGRGRRWLGRTLAIETALFVMVVLVVSAATTLTGAGG